MPDSGKAHTPFLPRKFFVTSGVATSFFSPLNAFDAVSARQSALEFGGSGESHAWGNDTGWLRKLTATKDKEAIDKELRWKLQETAKIQELNVESIQNRSEFIEVPKGKYDAAVVAPVCCPWRA